MLVKSKLFTLIFGRLLQIVITFLALKIATIELTVDEMGRLYLLLSITGFFGFFLIAPVGQYINRNTNFWFKSGELLDVLRVYNYYLIFISIFSILIVYILDFYKIGQGNDFLMLIIAIPLFVYFHSVNQTIIPMMNLLGNYLIFIIFTVMTQLSFLIISYILITFFNKTGILWFFGQSLAFGVMGFISFWYFYKKYDLSTKVSFSFRLSDLKKILSFSVPLAIGAFFFWVQTQSYVLVVDRYLGAEFLGYLGVGLAISISISASFEAIATQYLHPIMYKNMNSKKFPSIVSSVANLLIPIYFYIAIFITIYSIELVVILTNEKYLSSYVFVIFGAWIAFFRMSTNIISLVAHSKNKTKDTISFNIVGSIIAIFGVVGASIAEYNIGVPLALLIAGMASFGIAYVKMNTLIAINLRLKNIILMLIYSSVLLLPLYFYQDHKNILDSIFIIFLSGAYSIFVIFKYYNRIKGGLL
jgi:O-antigen/teichoic acid export membrane protein